MSEIVFASFLAYELMLVLDPVCAMHVRESLLVAGLCLLLFK